MLDSKTNKSSPRPSSSLHIWRLFTLCFTLGFVTSIRIIVDPDLGWHLKGGNWILANTQVPSFDFINYWNFEHNLPWVDYHWLSQVIFALIYNFFGFTGLSIFGGVIIAAIIASTLRSALVLTKGRISEIVGTILILISATLIFKISTLRPQLLAILLLSEIIIIILKNPQNRFLLVTFLTILIANIHVYWIFSIFIWITLVTIPRFVISFRFKDLLYPFSIALCGFVSPYGIKNYSVLLDYLQTPNLIRFGVAEFAPALTIPTLSSLITLILFITACRTRNLKVRQTGSLLLMLSALLPTLLSIKFCGLLAIFATPYIINKLAPWIRTISPRYYGASFSPISFASIVLSLICLTTFINNVFINQDLGQSALKDKYPIELCQQISDLSKSSIRVMTHFNDGGWCSWSSPNIYVANDGRTQFIPAKRHEYMLAVYNGRPNWEAALNGFNPQFVVVRQDTPIYSLLMKSPNWVEILSGPQFVGFKRS